MNARLSQQHYLRKIESFLFIFVMTQYFGALGQYSLVLNNTFEQIWSNLYVMAKMTLVALIVLQSIRQLKFKVKRKNFLITILIILLGCISIYESDMKGETASFILRLFMTIVIGVFVALQYSEIHILKMLIIAQIIFLLMTVLFIILFPEYAFFTDSNGQQVLIGIYTTKNPCAFELVFGALLFYISLKNSRKFLTKAIDLCMIGLQVVLAVQCRSIGAILTGIVAVIVTEILIQKKKTIRLDYLYVAINVCFFVVVLFLLPLCASLIEKLGRDVTLTGRTDIWLSIFQFLKGGNYLFGYGYESFWNNETITQTLYQFYAINGVKYNYTGAHNMMIELLLYFGVVGIVAYFIIVLNLLKRSQKFEGTKGFFILISFFFFTIHGVVERSLSDSAYDTMIFVLLLTMTARFGIFQKKKDSFYDEKNYL